MFFGRIKALNDKKFNQKGKYVLYCMEASQRADFNHSLEYAISLANNYKKPLLVSFFITDTFKHSNFRYYMFLAEGLIKTKKETESRGAKFVLLKKYYVDGALELGKNAFCTVLDKAYLKTQRKWRYDVASKLGELGVSVIEIESDVIIPIEYLSDKSISYAYLYRKKVEKNLSVFLKEFQHFELKKIDFDFQAQSLPVDSPQKLLDNLNIDKSVCSVEKYFVGGSDEAHKRLKDFVENKLFKYKELRSDPSKDYSSNLSPYLHFGQISPLEIVQYVLKNYDYSDENTISFLNELIVWRELDRNFALYNTNYNQYEGIPDWAKKTLEEHSKDKRDYIYSLEEFEQAKTHDIYWNAAQVELLKTGKIQNYMRMYWAKKILEWSLNPQDAFNIACYINDKYALDGRDPNGYSGISWCFGSFDRPWQERKVFGKIRHER